MYTKKVEIEMVKNEFSQDVAIAEYERYTRNIGLWRSEKIMFEKYVPKTASILDLGCGAGRTTIALYEQGWQNITGVDLSERMIESARKIAAEKRVTINFENTDASDLKFAENEFDTALFSYNGLMCIPERKNRVKAMQEIYRVLKKNGVFVFTTHDSEIVPEQYKQFWIDEKFRWENGTQDKRLHDFGDIITAEKDNVVFFLHIASPADVTKMFDETSFKLIETVMRFEIADENEAVINYSGDCRFWVARKQ